LPKRTKEEALETRQQILYAGLEIFSSKGFAVATLEEIAAQAGVTRGAVYWHFDGKAGLYSALVEEIQSRSSSVVLSAVAEGNSFTEVLQLVFIRLLVAVEEDKEFRSIIELGLQQTAGIQELEDVRQTQLQSGRALLSGIASAIQQAADDGEIRSDLDPAEIVRGFLALQNGLIYQWLADPDEFSLSQIGPSIFQIYLQGILPLS
jgi:TetR/AcrR family acrAB operon transcriptional repressor